jgi:putative transposase
MHKGHKRHLAVDTLGLPIRCQFTAASVQDRDAPPGLLAVVSRIRFSAIRPADRAVKGFIVLPKRWIVERTFGWPNLSRRLT